MKLRLSVSNLLSLLIFSVSLLTANAYDMGREDECEYNKSFTPVNGVNYAGDIYTWNASNKNLFGTTAVFTVTSYNEETNQYSEYGVNGSKIWEESFNGAPYCSWSHAGNNVGNTIRLQGASSDAVLCTDFGGFYLGGLIVEHSDYTYTLGRSSGDLSTVMHFQTSDANRFNMSIGADTVLLSGTFYGHGPYFHVCQSGDWTIEAGKKLSFQGGNVTLSSSAAVNVIGGTLDVQKQLQISDSSSICLHDGAVLLGKGISTKDATHAAIILNNGGIDESGYTVTISAGSGLEFRGANTLVASSVSLADNSFLNFSLEEAQISVNWNADLDIQGSLSLNLTHADKPVHDTYALLAMQGGNTVTGWDVANLSISGASAQHLVWENNTLYYRPLLVQENGDTTLDCDVDTETAGGTIGGKDDVAIDGNGHTLTVKNAVQLVQMALKNGTVKLEGENNGIVSVTLTEGGELVLTAGAGLKTGDIISMVASGKGELVISGDITLDEHGMKGKNGKTAMVSNMNATTTGDAVFENVAFTESLLDIGEGTTATFKNAVLGAGTRVTDAPATAKFENTLALLDSTNTEVVTESTTAEALQLYRSGDTTNAVTLNAGAAMVDLTCTVFDTITLSGSDLYLDLSALAVTLGDADAFSLTFTNGTLAAIDTDSLHIFATLDGEHYLAGYTTQQGGMAEKVYFATSASVPEPATATLSLLALAALAARRKRVA